MSKVNNAILIGVVHKEPKRKTLDTGLQMITFCVRTEEAYRDKLYKEYHLVSAFGDNAKYLYNIKAGDIVRVEGKLKNSIWEKMADNNTKQPARTVIINAKNVMVGSSIEELVNQSPVKQASQPEKTDTFQQEHFSKPSEIDDCPF